MLKALIAEKSGRTVYEIYPEEVQGIHFDPEKKYWCLNRKDALAIAIGDIPLPAPGNDWPLLPAETYLLGIYDVAEAKGRFSMMKAYAAFSMHLLLQKMDGIRMELF